ALAVAGVPLALEACQIVCVSSSSDPTPAHDTHQAHHHRAVATRGSCHETAPPRVSSHAPACDHEGEATVPSIIAGRTSDTVMQLAGTVRLVDDVVPVRTSTAVQARQGSSPDRLDIRRASPLRI